MASECVICQRLMTTSWFNPKKLQPIGPVCRMCERDYGGRPKPHGSFKDRRIATQINAIAEALSHEAYRQQHPWRR